MPIRNDKFFRQLGPLTANVEFRPVHDMSMSANTLTTGIGSLPLWVDELKYTERDPTAPAVAMTEIFPTLQPVADPPQASRTDEAHAVALDNHQPTDASQDSPQLNHC